MMPSFRHSSHLRVLYWRLLSQAFHQPILAHQWGDWFVGRVLEIPLTPLLSFDRLQIHDTQNQASAKSPASFVLDGAPLALRLIDFVGIDAYGPLSAWRDGDAHAATAISKSVYDSDYVHAGMNSGEAYVWYYAGEAAVVLQQRSPITEGAYKKPWIFRQKYIRGWFAASELIRETPVSVTDLQFHLMLNVSALRLAAENLAQNGPQDTRDCWDRSLEVHH
jgi:hypothetical protein